MSDLLSKADILPCSSVLVCACFRETKHCKWLRQVYISFSQLQRITWPSAIYTMINECNAATKVSS